MFLFPVQVEDEEGEKSGEVGCLSGEDISATLLFRLVFRGWYINFSPHLRRLWHR